jgi:uncharacterized membrane protein
VAKEGGYKGHWIARNLRRNFLAGLLVIIPVSIVILVLAWLFVNIDNVLQPIIKAITGNEIVGLGFVISLVVIYLVGLLTSNIVGHRLVRFGESIMARIPVARQIYHGSKQVIAGLSGTSLNKAAFREVVLVEFPRPGMKTIGFVTNEMKDKSGKPLLAVYIPTAPVPTSGYFEIVPLDMVTPTDIGVDQAMQMVISSGMISPEIIDTEGQTFDKAPSTDS